MTNINKTSKLPVIDGHLLSVLQERAKELTCLYSVEEVLQDPQRALPEVLQELVTIIPPGLQYPEICRVKIQYDNRCYRSSDFNETPWAQHASIVVQDSDIGRLSVYYQEERPLADDGPFFKEEIQLLKTISDRVSHFILHQRLKKMFDDNNLDELYKNGNSGQWRSVVNLLRKTDENLFVRISRKLMNYMCLSGIENSDKLMAKYAQDKSDTVLGESNQPRQKASKKGVLELCEEINNLAADHLDDSEILEIIQQWIHEDKSSFLIRSMADRYTKLSDVVDAIKRYQRLEDSNEIAPAARSNIIVSLVRRFFSEQLDFIDVAKNHIDISDFFNLVDRLIAPSRSHGKLGGKSSGLFLAERILKKAQITAPAIGSVKTPKTWYVTSDGLMDFLSHNDIEDVHDQKYNTIAEVRQDYPSIIQIFKSSHFSQEMARGLSMALDDFGDVPLIVRSSSLLEDRLGSAFSGKYKSLFLANQGDKKTRIEALMDAIAEVYASTFGPDAIEYRAERGLLNFNEEMGVLIQEVVGKKVGKYFFPAFAGVAFSRNEFRWSPRIKRKDGLVRIVPGLGTRAVDRLADDYPLLAAPGQPMLRVNVSTDERIRYCPKYMDVINLESNKFETRKACEIIKTCGIEYPQIVKIVSRLSDGRLTPPMRLGTDFSKEDFIVTFEGLFSQTKFLEKTKAVLEVLENALDTPVDIEFACDGKDFYLLQCRPQSQSLKIQSARIPEYIPDEDKVFSANRYISNGQVPDLTHLVYVVPEQYSEIAQHSDLVAVGQAIGALNKLLPKQQFVLMGPGRWGSRGDIKLGVRVTYSDINNTAMLVEISRKKGNYQPDLSFGTHFFQDLVEANIRYLPLYPDERDVAFNEDFLEGSRSILKDILPEYSHLDKVIRVIDVPKSTDGKILRVLMNADQNLAMGLICAPDSPVSYNEETQPGTVLEKENYWRWRMNMAECVGASLSAKRFGVEALYLFGSTKNITAGPESDIDLLVHFRGNDEQKMALEAWFEGWSLALDEMNYLKTGHRTGGLLDIYYISDSVMEQRIGYASKIGAITDAARKIPLDNS